MKQKKLNYKEQQRLYEKKTSDIISGIAAIFFIILTAVYPIFMTYMKYVYLTFQKTVFFWIITLAALVSILFMLIVVKKTFYIKDYYIENEPKRKISIPEWIVIGFILIAFISAAAASFNNARVSELYDAGGKLVKEIVWAGAPKRYEGFISFLCYVIVFFIIARFYKIKQSHLLVFAGSAFLISLYCILQFMGIDIFKLAPYNDQLNGYGPLSTYMRATFGNINIVSAYCTFAVILFGALFAVSKAKIKIRIFYITASAASFAMLLIANGDASKVAVLAAMVLFIPYWISDRIRFGNILIVLSGWSAVYAGYNAYLSGMKTKFEADPSLFAPGDQNVLRTYTPINIKIFLIVSISLLAAGLVLILLLKKWAERPLKIAGIIFVPIAIIGGLLFIEIMGAKLAAQPSNIIWQAREILHGNFGDELGSNRGWVWKSGISVLFNHPVLGTGPDTFLYALGDELQTESTNLYGVQFDKAHNIFLQIAVCMGIPALLLYIAFIGSLFVSAIKKAFERPFLLAFFITALGYAIQSFFCVEVPITTPLVWVAFGVISGEIWKSKIGFKEEN